MNKKFQLVVGHSEDMLQYLLDMFELKKVTVLKHNRQSVINFPTVEQRKLKVQSCVYHIFVLSDIVNPTELTADVRRQLPGSFFVKIFGINSKFPTSKIINEVSVQSETSTEKNIN